MLPLLNILCVWLKFSYPIHCSIPRFHGVEDKFTVHFFLHRLQITSALIVLFSKRYFSHNQETTGPTVCNRKEILGNALVKLC